MPPPRVFSSTSVIRVALGGAALGGAILVGRRFFDANGDADRGENLFPVVHADGAEDPTSTPAAAAGDPRDDLPTFSAKDVALHDTADSRIWVSFRHGVYDVTEFVEGHPGGEKILLAAGGSVEPFWKLYAVHKNDSVYEILESMRVGNLDPSDVVVRSDEADDEDPYQHEPSRHPSFTINSSQPFNGEPPASELVSTYITPNKFFYKRNHFPVPLVKEEDYVLEVSGEGIDQPLQLTLDDLQTQFPKHRVVSVVQCAGNRRSELAGVPGKPPAKGLSWGNRAIGNAEWGGALLSEVLQKAGLDSQDAKHVHFEGLENYGSSIPINKAIDPKNQVLLAYEMNGEPLPRDHGYPVRALVPGVVGARNVKWLGKVTTSKEESESHWQRRDYKGFNSSTTWETADFDTQASIQEMPVTASICAPEPESSAAPGEEITVRGYAHSGGGNGIVRVDVSADGGETWALATITASPRDQERERVWGWYLWEAKVSVPMDADQVHLVAKAVDSHYNVMPEKPDSLWNIRGVLSNAWSRVSVRVDRGEDE